MSEPRRILILTADAGFGHRSAANAIASALQESFDDRVQVSIVNPLDDRRTPFLLRESQSDYDRLVRRLPELYRFGYDASDGTVPTAIVERAIMVLMYEVARDLLRVHRPDVVVSTFPLYAAALSAVFTITRTSVPQFMVVTDLVNVHRFWFHRGVDGIMVPTATVQHQAVDLGFQPEKVFLTGIPVSPEILHQEQPSHIARAKLGWDPQRLTVLAVGGRRVDNLLSTLDVINHFPYPIQLAVVTGGDADLFQELSAWTWHIPCHLFDFVNNMAQLMQAADLIVCKAGGLITTEALAAGLPLILIDVIPGQEMGNAEYVVTQGAAELAQTPLDVLRTLHHWTMNDGAQLSQRAAEARRLGKPEAAFEIAGVLFQAAQRGPVHHERMRNRPMLIKLLMDNKVRWQWEDNDRSTRQS